MTTEEQTTEVEAEADAPPASADAGGDGGGDGGPPEHPEHPEHPAAAHPYRERYLIPFVFPLIIVAAIIIFVLNISRIFIATHGTGSVILATTITLIILVGATSMSFAQRMRASSAALTVVLSLVAVTGLGWLMIGAAEEHEEAAVELGPPVGELTIDALPTLKFEPAAVDAPADPQSELAVIQITLENAAAGSHTLAFDDANVQWTVPEVAAAGEKKTEKAGFPGEGDYAFYCTIPTHREAGMEGTLTITTDVEPQAAPEGEGGAGGEGAEEAPAG